MEIFLEKSLDDFLGRLLRMTLRSTGRGRRPIAAKIKKKDFHKKKTLRRERGDLSRILALRDAVLRDVAVAAWSYFFLIFC